MVEGRDLEPTFRTYKNGGKSKDLSVLLRTNAETDAYEPEVTLKNSSRNQLPVSAWLAVVVYSACIAYHFSILEFRCFCQDR